VERLETCRKSGVLTATRQSAVDLEPAPACSVVIPSFNGRDLLARCLASITRHRPASTVPRVEVIVVDDGSSDDTAAWLGRTHPEMRVVRLARNAGFCGAANAGIALARGSFIQVLNNDTEVGPGWIEAALAPFADASVGAVAPLVLVRSDPARVDSAGDSYSVVGWPAKRGHGQPAAPYARAPVQEVFGISGTGAFYRGEILRRMGGFDLIFGSYYEDVDLSFRLRWAGYRCVFAPESVIYHEISATYDHANPELQRRMARNAEIVFWANLPRGTLARAALPHLAFVFAQAAWRLVRGRLRPFLLGKWDAVRVFPLIRERRRLRAELARTSIAPPHFPLTTLSLRDVRNHLRRPAEASRSGPDRPA
jgi:GT2 family glycosyltransferase